MNQRRRFPLRVSPVNGSPLRLPLFLLACALASATLPGCTSVYREGSADVAGIGGAAIAAAITSNAAVSAGIGLGVQSLARTGVQYTERRLHGNEQDEIARVAGTLPVGGVARWQIEHEIRLEPNEGGQVSVSRVIGAGNLQCKEIVFSVDREEKGLPAESFYVATVCQSGDTWRWASAEPATERWGALQ
jgi:hypothetical protein